MAVLQRKIKDLELENKNLRHAEEQKQPSQANTLRPQVSNDDRNWMASMNRGPPQQLERPVTASATNAKVREVQDELKREQKEKRKLFDEIEQLKKEIQK